MFNLKHGIIKKLLSTLTILSLLIPHAVFADSVAQSQRMLNQLGYNAGPVDGAYGGKTKRALEAFYAKSGGSYDGKLDANEVTALKAAVDKAGITSAPFNHSAWRADNKWNETVGPQWSSHLRKLYNSDWPTNHITADMNNDSILDFVYAPFFKVVNMHGSMTGSVPTDWNDTKHTYCYDEACAGEAATPTIYFGRSDGSYILGTGAVIDNRDEPGYLMGIIRVADFNGDNKPDMFINETLDWEDFSPVNESRDGRRDSYFLSQPDGTWVESSDTHLSNSNWKVFDHGYAIGDLDGDNDIDIVMTTHYGDLACWMNQGGGHMKLIKVCGKGIKAFTVELGDMDGDGDLDVLSSHMEEGQTLGWNPGETAIHYNNGKGSFRKNSVRLKEYTGKWDWNFTIDFQAADFDNDGDMDIIMSRNRSPYIGLAYEVSENLGNGKFKTHGIEVISDIPNYTVAKHQAILTERNTFNESQYLRLSDLNNDGLMDYISYRGAGRYTDRVYINNGDFTFTEFDKNDKKNPLKRVTAGSFNQKDRFYMKDMY